MSDHRKHDDQPFLDKYCVGYDEKTLPADAPKNGHYKAYILGQGKDGIAKTPEWAAQITGIPADRIVKLAREIGSAKPAYISQGWGPQRHANGEIATRAISMLAILTGNVGINGGNSGAREAHTVCRLNVCLRWKTQSKPASLCLCGRTPLSEVRR